MEYKIFAAMKEHIDSGWIWVKMPKTSSRTVVVVENLQNGSKIYCEAMQIDANFLKDYNGRNQTNRIGEQESSLVLNEWYRKHLGIFKTQETVPLDIKSADCWYGKLRAAMDHPQNVVRLATWIALLSLLLGVVGVGLGVCALFRS